MGNYISQDQLAAIMVSVLKGHVHFLFANLCVFSF